MTSEPTQAGDLPDGDLPDLGPASARYEITAPLAKGAMAAVYVGRSRSTGQPVVVKTVRDSDVLDRKLLEREARHSGSVTGPGFARLYEVFSHNARLFIVREFIDGMRLQQWQAGRTTDEILRVYARIADALAELHERGLIHRDMKPSNVLIRNRSWEPVIIDFGLAVRPTEQDAVTSVARTVVGTPHYLSPEMIVGEEPGPGADVFALGIMLIEAITGDNPWGDAPPHEMLMRIVSEAPSTTVARFPQFTPLGLDALIVSILQKAPLSRPTASHVATVLRARAAHLAPSDPLEGLARAPDVEETTGSYAGTTVLPGASSPAPGTTVIAVAPPTPARASSPAVAPPLASRSSRASNVPAWLAVGLGVLVVGGAATISWAAAASVAITCTGLGFLFLVSIRRGSTPAGFGMPSEAVLQRISAIEAQMSRASEMTQTIAVALDDLGAQVRPDKLKDLIRASVVVALQELQPAANVGDTQGARDLLELLRSGNTKPRWMDRLKEYGGLIGGGATAIAGFVGFLNSTDIWRMDRPPEIRAIGAAELRLRRDAPVTITVDAVDPDGDDMTFTWDVDAGRIDAKGSSAMWTPTTALDARFVTVKVTADDGSKQTSRSRTLQVNSAPRGALVVEGTPRPESAVRLTAQVQDPDGDPVTLHWVASAGQLMQSTGRTVLWTAPPRPSTVQILCNVSDGFETVSLALSVVVKLGTR